MTSPTSGPIDLPPRIFSRRAAARITRAERAAMSRRPTSFRQPDVARAARGALEAETRPCRDRGGRSGKYAKSFIW